MSAPNDGGPAFPVPESPECYARSAGMSLRDWFAGQALAGICGNPALMDVKGAAWAATYAHELADAMLAARNKETTKMIYPQHRARVYYRRFRALGFPAWAAWELACL